MNFSTWTVLAENSSHTYYRFARLQSMSEWWHWLLLAAICGGVIAYVAFAYLFDGVDLRRATKWSLVLLRILALAGILFFFLDMEKRTENQEVKHSRAVVLIDTSQSMGLQDAEPNSQNAGVSRIDQINTELQSGAFLEELRSQHDVAVYRFDQQSEPQEVAFFSRTAEENSPDRAESQSPDSQRDGSQRNGLEARSQENVRATQKQQDSVRRARSTAVLAAVLIGVSLLGFLIFLVMRMSPTRQNSAAWLAFFTLVIFVAGILTLAIAHLGSSDLSWEQIAGLMPLDTVADVAVQGQEKQQQQGAKSSADAESSGIDPDEIAWQEALLPRGTETRIGDSLQSLITRERGGPIAGLVLLSDGRNNAGIDCVTAVASAQAAQIPIYAVGLGSDRQPVNVRVVDLEAPKRVFPGDRFVVTGYIQAFGLKDRLVSLELESTEVQANQAPDVDQNMTLEDEQSVRLPADGEVLPVRFEISPSETGTYLYQLRVIPPDQDIEKRDDQKTARVKVVDRKTRVLLLASGPTREYRFLRNQLFRDQDTTVDVILQSSGAGISQEADNVLDEFPVLADELFQYDCILAFDPDWLELDILQLRLLDRWVAEQAGGLVVIAGPIHTPDWTGLRRGRDPRVDVIRALYPVVFYSQGSANLSLGRFGGESAWPLNFTQDGIDADFFRLEDDPLDSEAAWSSFEGVFGYYSVKDPKPGARVFARFSNPETSIDGELPIYAAAHLYGAGRVYFQASGEMWRLRAVDERFFETYYTKLIRWASQGRLLRDSSRGILLVDKDRCLLGDHVTVRAVLNDSQHKPVILDEVPAILLTPNGQRRPIALRKVQNTAREGMFELQFATLQQGDYRIELTPPDSPDNELLTTEVRVRVPALEIENPQRNDALLKEIAEQTGGQYFIGTAAAMNHRNGSRASLTTVLEPNDQVVFLPASIDSRFDERLMGWLMVLISGFLAMEWLVRRLSKLA